MLRTDRCGGKMWREEALENRELPFVDFRTTSI
jgi:hypothetical protein